MDPRGNRQEKDMDKRKIMSLAIIISSAVLIVNVSRSIWDLRHRRDILGERERVLKRLEAERARLEKEYEYVKSPEFIEQEARNRLGLAREGEQVVLLPEKKESGISNQESGEGKANIPNWKKWWRLFF